MGFLNRLFGWVFEGCWHEYSKWGEHNEHKGYLVFYQKSQCNKCGKIKSIMI